jgi:heptaprenyl diphosphate synthase
MKYSTLRLISGAFIIVGILQSKSLVLRFCITVFIIILALSSGRKFRLLPNMILLITISLANTLTPNGLVIFSIGSYPITLGSLTIGANKALLLISFIYASHYMMSTRPQIPGKLGAIISLQFYYFDRLTTKWHQIDKKRPLIEAIDQLLLGIEDDIDGQPIKPTETRYAVKKDVFIHILHISIIILLLLIFSEKAKSLFPFIALLP